jgi:hypothetical protein
MDWGVRILTSPKFRLENWFFGCIINLIRLAEVDSQWLSGERPKGRFSFFKEVVSFHILQFGQYATADICFFAKYHKFFSQKYPFHR